jgi:hypothetical protein
MPLPWHEHKIVSKHSLEESGTRSMTQAAAPARMSRGPSRLSAR